MNGSELKQMVAFLIQKERKHSYEKRNGSSQNK
jgi:hypothetical protein